MKRPLHLAAAFALLAGCEANPTPSDAARPDAATDAVTADVVTTDVVTTDVVTTDVVTTDVVTTDVVTTDVVTTDVVTTDVVTTDAITTDVATADGATSDVAPTAGPVLHAWSSPGAEYVKAIERDAAGDIYAAAVFNGSVTVDGARRLTARAGGGDVGLVRYDRGTGAATLAVAFGGDGLQVPHGVAVDAGGEVVVVGYTRGAATANLDPAQAPAAARAYSGGEKPFVARYTAAGAHRWSWLWDNVSGGADTNLRAWDVAVDPSGAVYVVGHFRGRFDLDPTPDGARVVESTNGTSDLFVVKLDAAGRFVWGFAVGGPGADAGQEGTMASPGGTGDVAVAVRGGRVFVVGTFEQTARFDGAAAGATDAARTSRGQADAFIARYDAGTGALERVRAFGSAADDSTAPGSTRIGSDGRIYVGLRTAGALEVEGAATLAGTGAALALLSFDEDLALRWGARMPSAGGLDGIHRVAPDGRGGVYVAGWFNGATDFDPGPGVAERSSNTTGATGADLFVARYEDVGASAALRWVSVLPTVAPGAASQIVAGLAADGDGHAWIGGQYFAPTDFDPGAGARTLTCAGANDGFVARYRRDDGALF